VLFVGKGGPRLLAGPFYAYKGKQACGKAVILGTLVKGQSRMVGFCDKVNMCGYEEGCGGAEVED